MTYTIRTLLVALQLLVIPFTSHAGNTFMGNLLPEPYVNKPIAEGAVVWYCVYAGNALIRCRLAEPGYNSMTAEPALYENARVLARQIVEKPQSFAGQIVQVPLLGPPFGFDLAGQLAESVVCGRRRDCGIVFGESPEQLVVAAQQYEAKRLVRRLAANLPAN